MDDFRQQEIKEGETIGVWLPCQLRKVFRRHVGFAQGAAGRFGVNAVREKLEREGAFRSEPGTAALQLVKDLKPAELQIISRLVELLAVRGPEAVGAKLAEIEAEVLETAGGGK